MSDSVSPPPKPADVLPSEFVDLVDLAASRLGGFVLYANDDFFASKDNLLNPRKPIFIDGKYTDRGKWMDGWESRRRRTPGHDYCIVRLGLPGVVRGVIVDTSFFVGNYPERCSIEGVDLPGTPSVEALLSPEVAWQELLGESPLRGGTQNSFRVHASTRVTHLRFNIFPDGGVARLRVHGEVVPERSWMGRPGALVDLASVEHGAIAVATNDQFFGSRHNLLFPGRALDMGDGWETKRSRRPGPDWVVVRLAALGVVEKIEIDTTHFRGNAPESASLEIGDGSEEGWREILPRTKLEPHTRHHFDAASLDSSSPAGSHVRLRIWPDGGVSRLRLWGVVGREGRQAVGLRRLATLPARDLESLLAACCGSAAWVRAMRDTRPFASMPELRLAATRFAATLSEADWREAFAAHPRIGERPRVGAEALHASWSEGEQAQARAADEAALRALADVNRAYEERFGFIFIVCASGKSVSEMLELARARLANEQEAELRVAAEEQRKITELRLEKLVMGES